MTNDPTESSAKWKKQPTNICKPTAVQRNAPNPGVPSGIDDRQTPPPNRKAPRRQVGCSTCPHVAPAIPRRKVTAAAGRLPLLEFVAHTREEEDTTKWVRRRLPRPHEDHLQPRVTNRCQHRTSQGVRTKSQWSCAKCRWEDVT